MKKIMFLFVTSVLFSCGSPEKDNELSSDPDAPKEEATAESKEKLKKVQDLNVEIEEIDGELDSLINALD